MIYNTHVAEVAVFTETLELILLINIESFCILFCVWYVCGECAGG